MNACESAARDASRIEEEKKMGTKLEKYGLDKYVGGSRNVGPGEAEKRMELLEKAREDFERQNGYRGGLGDLYDWLRKPA